MGPIALITGATSGIGKASAETFAKNHYDLIITGRRQEKLDSIADELRKKSGRRVLALSFDVRDKVEVEENLGNLPEEWSKIAVLVNNAGLAAGHAPIQTGAIEDWETMIDTNVKGLLYVTRVISKAMIAMGKGHIINIGSLAGKEVYPNGNVYCATKFAVDALTKSTRIDLLPFGIKVTQISPGLVETEFSIVRFKGDEAKAKSVYKGFEPLTAHDVADAIWYAASRPQHVQINDIVLTPLAQASTTLIHRKS